MPRRCCTPSPDVRLLGIDRDAQALARAGERLAGFGSRVRLVQANFHQLAETLAGLEIRGIAGFLADLGVSSLQLESPERGFSFRFDGPLDMRMGLSETTAADLVNQASEGELETIFRDYGEERQARRIARAIARSRTRAADRDHGRAARLIAAPRGRGRRARRRSIPPRASSRRCASRSTRSWPASRGSSSEAVRMMATDGRLVVISYHSLEDRIVKNTLRDLAHGEVDPVTGRSRSETQLIEVLTRKPLRPTEAEVDLNPRSRSGTLRAARRL